MTTAPRPERKGARLALGALGVVYGDIGTSPLYALRECFHGPHAIEAEAASVLGVLSLIAWSLILIVSIKYLILVLRADNRGEGGILALTALTGATHGARPTPGRWLLLALGLAGTALLYGDGMITPAISVLGAVEGLEVAAPALAPFVIPIAAVVLAALFAVQRRGTGRVGAIFGPVMVVWFLTLAALGAASAARSPEVLLALDPRHGLAFLAGAGSRGFLVLGAVFLVVTGAEALYADMGHFGRRPIRLAWFALVFPALLLNYLGQGALLLRDPSAASSPFFRLAPSFGYYPLVVLAAAAAVIASQALISGAFSLTRQAVQLGYCPRVVVRHTSPEEIGQIYVPGVNAVLFLSTLALVVGFRSSSALAGAYGVAVAATMVVTTLLACVVLRERWRVRLPVVLAAGAFFLVAESAFLGANSLKFLDGGWVPLLVGAIVYTLMTTWRRGRALLADRLAATSVSLDDLFRRVAASPPVRVPGTAIYLTGKSEGTPPALLHNLRHNGVLHQRVGLLRVVFEDVSHVPPDRRVEVEEMQHGFFRLTARYGFMDSPDVPRFLERCDAHGAPLDPQRITFVLGRETILATRRPGMALWRERLFAFMSRNAQRATAFFRLPPDRVLDLGAEIEI